MSKFEKNMEEIFDVTPTIKNVPVVVPSDLPIPSTSMEEDLGDAYQQSKDNLQDIILQGKEAMDEILRIAKESEHPRAFEVFGGILKNVVDANKELLSMQKQMREMDDKKETTKTIIDKAVFVGSTKELGDLLKSK